MVNILNHKIPSAPTNLLTWDDAIILDYFMTYHKEKAEELYNFSIILKYFYDFISFEKINKIEEQLYDLNSVSEIERQVIILENFQKITQEIINELIKKDFDVLELENPPVACSTSNIYSLALLPNFYIENVLKSMLPRTKNNFIKVKIINNNIVMSTLKRLKNLGFFCKFKKKPDNEEHAIMEIYESKIKRTKG